MKLPEAMAKPAETSSATPLISLNAVCLDTETTGLDTSVARVIQIGAIRIRTGCIDQSDIFEKLVDPGEPIPSKSSAIHGLYDRDVAGAAKFCDIKPEFDHWMANSIVIGFSIGFDLAVMKRESELTGLQWQAPRSMDVRHLAQLAAPQLPDYSLDTVAEWLGIEIHNRHSAFGDALAAAQVFVALVPKLNDRGIRTITEAERGSRKITQQIIAEAESGWQEAIRTAGNKNLAVPALARIDSFPYRHRVADLMTAPPVTVDGTKTLKAILKLLADKKISSVFVVKAAGCAHGIVTERDVLRAINLHGATALDLMGEEIMQFPLQTVAAKSLVYRAISKMNRNGFRHLGVHDDKGKIVGALSVRDLLRQRGQDAISLGDQIADASSAHDLGLVWANLALVTQGLVSEEVDVRDIAAIISSEMCALTRRACELAEAKMADEGHGAVPVPYAMLVLGSGGRGESLLAMDQDNAIIYAAGKEGGAEDVWFAELGKRASNILHLAGVPYCKGGIMASNRKWRMSLTDWHDHVANWISRHTPKDILNTDIFFDAVAVHGDEELSDKVLDAAFAAGGGSREFLQLMSVNACEFSDSIGWFGRIKLSDGRIDLKKNGIMPIFSAARIGAIANGVRARSTLERLTAVKTTTQLPGSVFDNIIEVHRILLDAILKQQLRDLDEGIALSNRVAPQALSAPEYDQLKWALKRVTLVSNVLGDPLAPL